MNFLDERVPANIWNKIQPCPMSGCWIWTGAIKSGGYANVKIKGQNKRVHRVLFRAHKGRWPYSRRVLDHKCRVRCCVNPAHMRETTNRKNTLLGESPGAKAYRARKAKQ